METDEYIGQDLHHIFLVLNDTIDIVNCGHMIEGYTAGQGVSDISKRLQLFGQSIR